MRVTKFTKCEVEILTSIWAVGRDLTAEDIWAGIYVLHGKDRAIHIIIKYLDFLAEKGIIKKYFNGECWFYHPLIDQKTALKTILLDHMDIYDKASKNREMIRLSKKNSSPRDT